MANSPFPRKDELPCGVAELWRYSPKSYNWHGPELHRGLTHRQARALLTNGSQLVRWRPPWRASDVLMTRSEALLDRFTRKPCRVSGCDRPATGRGMCMVHYSRIRRAEIAERERALVVEGDWQDETGT